MRLIILTNFSYSNQYIYLWKSNWIFMCKAFKTWCSCTVHVSIHITNKVIPNTFLKTRSAYCRTSIKWRLWRIQRLQKSSMLIQSLVDVLLRWNKNFNTDYVHKILSWLIYQCYSNDRKWRIAACRHRMLCLLESSTNGSINTLFKNYPSILYMSNLFLTSVTS